MLQVDDYLLLSVELNHQPEGKHPLWCSHNMCKNKNNNLDVGPMWSGTLKKCGCGTHSNYDFTKQQEFLYTVLLTPLMDF